MMKNNRIMCVTKLMHSTFINRSTEIIPFTRVKSIFFSPDREHEESRLPRTFSEESSAHADVVNLSIRPWKKPGWDSLWGL